MPKSRPPYPPEVRRRMVALVRSGRSPESLAEEYEPSSESIRNWVRQAERDEGKRHDGLTSAEKEELVRLRREVRALLRAGSGRGLGGLDTGRLRMTFPCRLRIRHRSGRVVELEGHEPGASARPVDEQRAVIEARCRAASIEPAVATG